MDGVGDTTTFRVRVGGPGPYAVGVSTTASVIALSADTVNMYLRDDGIPDILAQRRTRNELTKPARERYHKHVKALLQVGDSLGPSFDAVFGYPAEIIPLANPYGLRSGATLRIRVIVDGKPVPNQYSCSAVVTPAALASSNATRGPLRMAPRAYRSRAPGSGT